MEEEGGFMHQQELCHYAKLIGYPKVMNACKRRKERNKIGREAGQMGEHPKKWVSMGRSREDTHNATP